jgi:hypothetical protein
MNSDVTGSYSYSSSYSLRTFFSLIVVLAVTIALAAIPLTAQTDTGSLRGKVTDPSGAVIQGASITAIAADGKKNTVTTNHSGVYEIKGLVPGKYTVSAVAKGFAVDNEVDVNVPAGPAQSFDIALGIEVEQQSVTVQDEANQVGLSPTENSSAVVIKGKDLEALSDDPDELQSELEALAGPSAGPNGGQIYIDGFTGGQLPPKSSIREIRVNSDPFSAEYDKLGYGRIEIFTKPGTDSYHGRAFFNEDNSALNSKNPFVSSEPSYHSEIYDGNLGGPLGKKASFFLSAQRRNINDISAINALVADPTFTDPSGIPFTQAIPNPSTRTNISPRIDYQISKNNTLTARYQFEQEKENNEGIGQTSLASLGYNEVETENTLQVSDSQVLSNSVVNETRFQYLRDKDNLRSQDSDPMTQVLGFFSSGGNSKGSNLDLADNYELQNYTSIAHGKHFINFGVRERIEQDSNFANSDFNGVFTFPSLAAYNVTQAGLLAGQTPAQSRAACLTLALNPQTAQCGASQFSITAGQPSIANTYADTGLYADDTWRARRNITISYGLRWETQNQIHDHGDFAPRVGLAWGLGGKNGSPKTVLRAGSGIFYDRFKQEYLVNAQRLNGITQQEMVVNSPDCYPDPSTCPATTTSPTVYRVSPDLRAPYIIQSAASVERQIAKGATVAVTYLNSRGVHQFLSENINAPLPGTFNPADPASGTRPLGASTGNVYQYVSEGLFKQNQIIANVRYSMGAKLSLFGFYVLNYSNADAATAASFPSNQYDLAQDYGRSTFDVRHRAFIGGSITLPERFNLFPFIVINSGTPFNVTVGQDLNGDSIFNDRPGLVSTNTCSTVAVNANIVCSPWGTFNSTPAPGDRLAPINTGTGPANATLNLRLSRTFGFGPETKGGSGGQRGGGMGGGRRGGGGPGGGLGPGGLNGGGGGGNPFAMGGSGHRYSLTFSISARNLFNSENLAPPVGDLNSSRFGQSIQIAGGPFSSQTASRRLDMQVAFSF